MLPSTHLDIEDAERHFLNNGQNTLQRFGSQNVLQEFEEEDFEEDGNKEEDELPPIEFRSLKFKYNLTPGTNDSKEFHQILSECKTPSIFETDAI